MSDLFILRGLPNSGKSTVAEMLAPGHVYAADDFWYQLMEDTDLSYRDVFDITRLHQAHRQCQSNVEYAMADDTPAIAVANTNLTRKEYKKYVDLAEEYGYRVHYLLIERGPNHGDNDHGVPDEAIDRMVNKFRFVDTRLRDEYA